jgi:hypothetical protein
MRKLILLPFLLTGMILFSFSCKKESRDIPAPSAVGEMINVRIAPNQPYQMDLTNAGTVSISKQASHFSMSETIMNNENGSQSYKYIPAKDFAGNDEVVLLSNKTEENLPVISGGGCPGNSNGYTTPMGTRYTTIKIMVSN